MAEIIDTADMNLDALTNDEGYWLYNGLDCVVTYDVFNELNAQCDDVAHTTYEFSKALQAPILEMNLRGLRMNKRRKVKVIHEMKQQCAQLEEQLATLVTEGVGCAEPVNWRSPKQLQELLYDTMGLPQQKSFKGGVVRVTTDEAALEKLGNYFIAEPIVNHILALRGLGKTISFLETQADPDGRMRTRFNIAGTNTGRFASSATDFGTGTNLQNVTSSLRSVFVADEGMMFCNIDLEQADSRNVGALCWELLYDNPEWTAAQAGAYLDACEGGDLHTLVCRMANPGLDWGSEPDRAIADRIAHRHLSFRDLAKKLGHGSNYLGTPPTMAKHARIPSIIAKEFQSNYFQAFPCIPAWHSNVFWQLENLGFLTTPLGRRRFFFDRPTASNTRREAVAYTPQSMTADEINQGILRLWRSGRVQLLVQVHDSILFQFPEDQRDEIVPWAIEQLEATRLQLKGGREFYVPAEAATGWNWGYASEANPDGLRKWKGGDERSRTETQFQLSLADF